ncbi:hypothetical protein K438DRAFT_1973677 [Mycena galopus ATCC 62051]|nr:hypothetical protein K438DRAFT_1973677 [Mycena galopus ATCC 62051]
MASTSRLPPELERDIFEIFARSNLKSIPTLLLVAHRVKIWLEPILYDVVVFCYPSPGHLFFDAARFSSALHSRAFSQHVKNLLCTNVKVPRLEAIFANCSAVQNLALVVKNSTLPPFPSSMPLRRLYTKLERLFPLTGVDFTHSLFAQLTHLELMDGPLGGQREWAHWRGIAPIPNLTHLAFLMDHSVTVFQGALAACPTLRVLVYLYYANPVDPGDDPDLADVFESLARDTRFVCVPAPNFIRDWEIGARGGEDFWVRAETFIAQRDAGEIDPETFVLREE